MGYTYNGTAFTQQSVLNISPNTGEAGIWMGGGAPSADSNGHLYVITGNGTFDGAATSGTTDDYGDSFLQLAPGAGQNHLGVSSFFTPTDQLSDNQGDKDFGSGGSELVLNLPGSGSSPQHLVVGGGKDGALYVLNGDQMGGSGDGNAWQMLNLGHGLFATSAFWNNTLYVAPVGSSMLAYSFDPGSLKFALTPASTSSATFGFPGSSASVSGSGASANGVVWALDNHNYCTPQSGGCGPAVLHAWAAGSLATELWNSSLSGRRCRRQRRQVHRAHGSERQGVRRHPRQQHRRDLRLDHRVRRARRLRAEAQLRVSAAELRARARAAG